MLRLSEGSVAFLSSFSRSRRCSRNRSPSRFPVSPMHNFMQRVQVMQQMTLAEVEVKCQLARYEVLYPRPREFVLVPRKGNNTTTITASRIY